MIRVFKKRKPRKFNYIPKFYDKKNQNLIYYRMGDGKFAQNYVHKKKLNTHPEQAESDARIDFTSFRVHSKASDKKTPLNVLLIVVMMVLILTFCWIIIQYLEQLSA